MADTLDHDVDALKQWLRSAWRYLADPSLTVFERRELRNYMKEADAALRAGLRRTLDRERERRDAMMARVGRRVEFRILRLET